MKLVKLIGLLTLAAAALYGAFLAFAPAKITEENARAGKARLEEVRTRSAAIEKSAEDRAKAIEDQLK